MSLAHRSAGACPAVYRAADAVSNACSTPANHASFGTGHPTMWSSGYPDDGDVVARTAANSSYRSPSLRLGVQNDSVRLIAIT